MCLRRVILKINMSPDKLWWGGGRDRDRRKEKMARVLSLIAHTQKNTHLIRRPFLPLEEVYDALSSICDEEMPRYTRPYHLLPVKVHYQHLDIVLKNECTHMPFSETCNQLVNKFLGIISISKEAGVVSKNPGFQP